MITTYFRSSSLGGLDFCEQKYFLDYVLGLDSTSNQKADKGTILHKIMETLAIAKKRLDECTDETIILNEDIGNITVKRSEFLQERIWSDQEVDYINQCRKSKTIFVTNCDVNYGHKSYGVDLINEVIDKSYKYYTTKLDHHTWTKTDLRDITNWAYIALDYNGGQFDPRKRCILQPEQRFDLVIDKPWAEYSFVHKGKELTGKLAIKGTIDLVTKLSDDMIECIDYKTGQRKAWASADLHVKDLADFHKDQQLMLYYYAIRKLYPDFPSVILTIFYVRDGGPFSVCFDDHTLDLVEENLKNKFQYVKDVELPKMLSPTQHGFKCQKLCHFYKNNWPGTHKNQCMFIHEQIKKLGIEEVTNRYQNPNFEFGKYKAPG